MMILMMVMMAVMMVVMSVLVVAVVVVVVKKYPENRQCKPKQSLQARTQFAPQ